jgi:hypothetical protein
MRQELERAKESAERFRMELEEQKRSQSGPNNSSVRPSSSCSNDMEYEFELPRRQSSELLEDNYSLRVQVTELQDQLVQQDAALKARVSRDMRRDEEEWDALTARLHNSEKEAQERLQQLLDLKHSISSLTRAESQVTDNELVEKLGQLYHRIREWVISNFRRSKLGANFFSYVIY